MLNMLKEISANFTNYENDRNISNMFQIHYQKIDILFTVGENTISTIKKGNKFVTLYKW